MGNLGPRMSGAEMELTKGAMVAIFINERGEIKWQPGGAAEGVFVKAYFQYKKGSVSHSRSRGSKGWRENKKVVLGTRG